MTSLPFFAEHVCNSEYVNQARGQEARLTDPLPPLLLDCRFIWCIVRGAHCSGSLSDRKKIQKSEEKRPLLMSQTGLWMWRLTRTVWCVIIVLSTLLRCVLSHWPTVFHISVDYTTQDWQQSVRQRVSWHGRGEIRQEVCI